MIHYVLYLHADPNRRRVKHNQVTLALLLMLEHEIGCKGVRGGLKWIGTTTIEHILPQSMKDPSWTAAGWDSSSCANWLHSLGNLALLNDGDNSSWGSSSYAIKHARVMAKPHLFSCTITDLEKYLTWTPADVEERQQQLLARFRTRWSVPEQPAEHSGQSILAVCSCVT